MVGWGWFGIFGGGALQSKSLSSSVVLFKPNISDKELSLKRYFIWWWFGYLVILEEFSMKRCCGSGVGLILLCNMNCEEFSVKRCNRVPL